VSIFKNHETTWHPPVLWVGIGCERNTSKELIINELKIGQIRLDARLLLDFFDIFNELKHDKNLKSNFKN